MWFYLCRCWLLSEGWHLLNREYVLLARVDMSRHLSQLFYVTCCFKIFKSNCLAFIDSHRPMRTLLLAVLVRLVRVYENVSQILMKHKHVIDSPTTFLVAAHKFSGKISSAPRCFNKL